MNRTSSSYRDEILRVFGEAGEPLSTRGLAYRCLEVGVFPSEWLESASVRAVQRECRKALKSSDIHGLPFAGKTDGVDAEGAPLWVQRTFWDFDTYALNIAEHLLQSRQNREKANLLLRECLDRFGRVPEAPHA